MSGGGGKSSVVGYKYFLGVQLAVCHGPVDKLRRIIIGEREAFNGEVVYPTTSTFDIDKPELFGGDAREGGVVGTVDVLWGHATQGRNAYLSIHQGAACPAYRGIFSLLFKSFLWASGNPYFKAPWVDFTRIKAGWRDDVLWNPTKAEIFVAPGEPPDMNAAHIIYQCLTDVEWGMGYNYSDIDETSFAAVAQTLVDENLGLSLMWDQQSNIETFIKTIINHIDGSVSLDMSTGKFVCKLHRGGYDAASLVNLNPSNILELKSFQRATFGEFANEVVVTYVDRDGNDKPIAVQDLASIQSQGSVVSTSRRYQGIRNAKLAARLAMRDLRVISTPLAKVSLTTNRVLYNKVEGDVITVTWPDLNIVALAMRIVKISKGRLTEGKIEVDLIEDVFTLPGSAYTSTSDSSWIDTAQGPAPAAAARTVEAPYWDIVRNATRANLDYLLPEYGFGSILATAGALTEVGGFKLVASPDNVDYEEVADVQFCPTGVLGAAISPIQTSFSLSGALGLANVVLAVDGGYAYVGDECVSVTAVNPVTGVIIVGRGVLDTTPREHSAGTQVYFTSAVLAYDTTERVSGETAYYKALTKTGLGTLPLASATAIPLVFNNRASRPYPPGNFLVNGLSYPAVVTGPEISASWTHRDRLLQTVDLVPHTSGNIGPEPGTTYRMRVYNGVTLLRTYEISGAVTSWGYPTDHSVDDLSLGTLRLVLSSVRDGVESWQVCDHTVTRSTVSGGVYRNAPPAVPTITASSVDFAIQLNWVFGDLRTNILHTEIWASDAPTFSTGSTLRYETYPTATYLHESTAVGAYRWYWARVADVDGNMSAWSAVSSARSGFDVGGVVTVSTQPSTTYLGDDVVFYSGDKNLYRWTGTNYVRSIGASDITGQIVGTQITDDSVTAAKLAANSVTANKIVAGTITAAQIAANTITANEIAANTITAAKLQVAQLSAIAADLGTVSVGADGAIKGGSTGYLANTGFWMGYHTDNYKFHIGDPTGDRIVWTGTGLIINSAQFSLSGGVATFKGSVNTGDFTGYAWPAAGGTGSHMSATGLLLGNPNVSAGNPDGKYFQVYTPAGGVPVINTNIPAYLADLQVTTLKIAGNAVTVPASAYRGASMPLTTFDAGHPLYNGMYDLLSVGLGTISGAPVYLSASFSFSPEYASYAGQGVLHLLRDGVLLYETDFYADAPSSNLTYSISMTDYPAPGGHTYTFRLRKGPGSWVPIKSASLFALHVKK